MRKTITPKLAETLDEMLLHKSGELGFYFYFLNYVDFYEDETLPMPTMGVTVKDMRLALIYHPDFVANHPKIEIMATLVHEVMHLIHHHLERGKYYNPQLANIAMDMIINHLIATYHTSVQLPVFTQEMMDDIVAKNPGISSDVMGKMQAQVGKVSGITLDPNYQGPLVFEPLYRWIKDENQKRQQGQSHQLSQSTSDALDAMSNGMTTDSHLPSDELMDEVKKQLTASATEKTKLQMRGFGSSNIEKAMELLLVPPRQNNLRLLKRVIAAMKGRQKVDTYSRINRRVPGVKGWKRVSQSINVGLDVSGSMWGRFEEVLGEIFRDGFEIDLVQIDTKIQKVERIHSKNELKHMVFKGCGGTELQPFVDYVLDPKNKLLKAPTVILTDGECDTLDFKGSAHQFLILSCHTEVKYRNGNNVKQIIVKQ